MKHKIDNYSQMKKRAISTKQSSEKKEWTPTPQK